MGGGGSKKARGSGDGGRNGDTDTEMVDSRERKLDLVEQVWEEINDAGEKERRDGLGQYHVLPDECVLRVLSFLPIRDIMDIACVSKHFFMLARDEFLWQTIYFSRGINRLYKQPDGDADAEAEGEEDILRNKKLKVKRRGKGKWRSICLKNFVMIHDVEVVLNEQMLGMPFERVEDLLGQFDEVTNVGRGSCYYFFHSAGLSFCCEEARVSSVLRHTPVESCSGSCWEKIVPLSI